MAFYITKAALNNFGVCMAWHARKLILIRWQLSRQSPSYLRRGHICLLRAAARRSDPSAARNSGT